MLIYERELQDGTESPRKLGRVLVLDFLSCLGSLTQYETVREGGGAQCISVQDTVWDGGGGQTWKKRTCTSLEHV